MAKRYKTVMTVKSVDRDIEQATLAEIEGCHCMNEEKVAEMDKRLDKKFGKSETISDVAPDQEVLDHLNPNQGDFLDNATPPASVMRPDR